MKFFFTKKQKRIYLDFAAATPMADSVRKEVENGMKKLYGNPSAIHTEGREAKNRITEARGAIATLLGVRKDGVFFTGSGTESNNLAIFGVIEALREAGRSYDSMEIVSTKLEHPSVLGVLEKLASQGAHVLYAPVDTEGRIVEMEFRKQLTAKTVLVTFAYVNSEIGVIQDVRRLVRAVRAFEKTTQTSIVVHVDGAQAPLWLPCDLTRLGADILSLDAGKCYGPKGVGVLACRGGVKLAPHFFGGGQESNLRPGTENTPLIIGCASSLVRAQKGWKERAEKVRVLRDYLINELQETFPDSIINGPRKDQEQEDRVANNVNVSIPGMDTEYATVALDTQGIAVSTKSACGGSSGGGSHVVREITGSEERAQSTLRITLGEETTQDELDRCVEALARHKKMMDEVG